MSRLTALLLQRHTIILLAFIFMLGIFGSLYVVKQEKERLMEVSAQDFAEDMSLFLREFRTLYSSEVIAKLSTHAIEVRHDYEQVDGAIPLPVTLTMKLVEGVSKAKTLKSARLYSEYPFPWRKLTVQDDFERDALEALKLKPSVPFVRIEKNNGQKLLRFATADIATTACISCHNTHPDSAKTDWIVGDVIGVLAINVSLDHEEAIVSESLSGMFYAVGVLILSAVLGLILIGFRLRRHAELLEVEVKSRTEELMQSQKMEAVGTLVGGIAHDFNNILAAITGAAFLAERNPESQKKQLKTIKDQAERASDMVKQLLAFARKDIKKTQRMSLRDLMQQSTSLFQLTASKSIQFNVDVCHSELLVKGDPTQLQQVIMNLINNARDALHHVATPVISVSISEKKPTDALKLQHPTASAGRYACISVSDNGHGIDEASIKKIFEPFFTSKEVGKGTGLGLSMVEGTIESHGGLIGVESMVGEGTTFSIYLPLLDSDSVVDFNVASDVDAYSEKTGMNECILLVDDEKELREVNAAILEELGYQIIEAADGLQAVDEFYKHKTLVKLVIMDVVMPRMGGIRAAEQIRSISDSVPIIFATGYDRSQVLGEAGSKLSHSAIITKPFKMNALHKLINAMI